MKESFDILMVGIGGQGTILASNILGEACLIEKRSVRGSETHGMAQRDRSRAISGLTAVWSDLSRHSRYPDRF
jgi:Pyruvate/2-oxoacid:ferredoxin oxidoreductase gamma subunit